MSIILFEVFRENANRALFDLNEAHDEINQQLASLTVDETHFQST